MKVSRALVWGLAVLLLILPTVVLAAGNGNPNPQVLPPNSHPHGMTYGEWGAKWWQWVYSIPATYNPLFDATGANAGVGQSGPVYFLAGVINVSGSAERTITIPAGKTLFFPIINCEWDNYAPPASWTVAEMYAQAAAAVTAASGLYATLDGRSITHIENYRGVSPGPFSLTLPDDNLWQAFGYDTPAGTYSPTVSDGYWLMLAPLPPGHHDLTFGGAFLTWDPPFYLDITYHINVVPGPMK